MNETHRLAALGRKCRLVFFAVFCSKCTSDTFEYRLLMRTDARLTADTNNGALAARSVPRHAAHAGGILEAERPILFSILRRRAE